MSKFYNYEQTNCEFKRIVQEITFDYATSMQSVQDAYEKEYRFHIRVLGKSIAEVEREVLADFRLQAHTSSIEENSFNLIVTKRTDVITLTITEKLPYSLKEFLVRINKLPKGEYMVQKENGKLVAVQKFSLE